jgi:predicted transcriptional regulator
MNPHQTKVGKTGLMDKSISTVMKTKEQVLQTLVSEGKPLKSGEIAEKAGIDKKEVDKAIKELKKEEKITSPKMCFYEAK